MNEVTAPKLNTLDRVRGWFSPEYAARASVNRQIADKPWRFLPRNSARRAADLTRTDAGWTNQPWANSGGRTLTSAARKEMTRRGRQIDENNILGSSMLDRAVDNVIGEGMTLQAKTKDDGWNRAAEALWKGYSPDARGMMDMGETQRAYYRAKLRDGDFGALLLKSGFVQGIEGDYITSPRGFDASNIIDGVEINAVGRPIAFHLSVAGQNGNVDTERVLARNMIWCARTNGRFNREAVRGASVIAEMGPMLDQIDGTIEAVVIAHRMAAIFGLIHKKKNPAAAFGALPTTASNAAGDDMAEFMMEPGMVQLVGIDDDIIQVKAEHPTTSFDDFMSFLIRIAGVKLGLPLELALLDFSKTNYSSARASMEQAYRRFRIEQRQFANTVLARMYRWRISKWMKDGDLPKNDEAFNHKWFGQPWPYLDPQKEAVGSMIAIDAGLTTLSAELAKRGIEFQEWLTDRTDEIKRIDKAGITTSKSSMTRDEDAPAGAIPAGANDDE